MNPRILALAALLAAIATGVGAAQSPDAGLDSQHPARFVSIWEQTSRHIPLLVLSDRKPGSSHEVDAASTMIIRFDREYLLRHLDQLNGTISVRGWLVKADRSRPAIEIPGYSEVGQEERTAVVRLRSASVFATFLDDLSRRAIDMHRRLDAIQNLTVTAAANVNAASRSRLQALEAEAARNHDSIAAQQRVVDSLRNAMVQLADSLPTRTDSASVRQQLTALANRLSAASSRAVRLLDTASVLRVQMIVARDSAVRANAALADGEKLRLIVREDSVVITTLLERLLAAGDSTSLDIIGRRIGFNPDGLRALAHMTLARVLPSLATTRGDSMPSLIGQLMRLINELEALNRSFLALPGLRDSLAADFVSTVKDVHLPVEQAGADPGDVLSIEIVNQADPGDPGRKLTVRIAVRQFGFLPRVADALLFLSRGPRRVPNLSGTAAIVDTVAAAYNFLPTPGVTFGWTLRARREWPLGRFWRWLNPGIGLNVAFPSFTTEVRQYTPPTATTPAAVVTQTHEEAGHFDLGVGVVVSFWDNALQLTWGRALSARTSPRYFAIGFSFVRSVAEIQNRLHPSQ